MGRKERRKMNKLKRKKQMEKKNLQERKAKAMLLASQSKPEVQEPTTEQLWRTAGALDSHARTPRHMSLPLLLLRLGAKSSYLRACARAHVRAWLTTPTNCVACTGFR